MNAAANDSAIVWRYRLACLRRLLSGPSKGLEVLAGLEADGLAGCDGDLRAGAWIPSDAGLAGFDGEYAEAAEFDAVAGFQGLLHGFKDGVYCGLGLGPWKSGALNDALDKVLFDQWWSPSC